MNPLDEIEIVKEIDKMITDIISNYEKYRDEYYVCERDYRRLLGIGTTKFWELKKLGRFEKGSHPATRGGQHRLYHRYFNPGSQRIELPELRRLPIEHPKHRRKRHGKTTEEEHRKTGSQAEGGK
jgi:hypothetical protein